VCGATAQGVSSQLRVKVSDSHMIRHSQ